MYKFITSFLLVFFLAIPSFAMAEGIVSDEDLLRGSLTSHELEEIKSLSEDELIHNYENGEYTYSLYQRLVYEGYISENSYEKLESNEVSVSLEDINLKDYGLEVDSKTGELSSITENYGNFSSMSSSTYYPGSSVKVRTGDMLVTNSTSSFGVAGHVGIVISQDRVVHMPGTNKQRDPNIAIERKGITQWFQDYPKTTVVRVKELTAAQKSGNWANDYQRNYGHKVTYKVPSRLDVFGTSYCSKFVYHSHNQTNTNIFKNFSATTLFSPYDILYTQNYSRANQPLIAYSKNGPTGNLPK